MRSERAVLEDVHADPFGNWSRYSFLGMSWKLSGMSTCVEGNHSIEPAASVMAHRPSMLGRHRADFQMAPGISGKRSLMLYCRPRRVRRKYVLFMRKLKMVPWLHGITFFDSPKTRNGYVSVLILMNGIPLTCSCLYTTRCTFFASY